MTSNPGMTWIGLMRHAESWYPGMDEKDQSERFPSLTKTGERSVRAIGRRFREFVDQTGGTDQVFVFDVGTPQSSETAAVIRQQLGIHAKPQLVLPQLSPMRLPSYQTDDERLRHAWDRVVVEVMHVKDLKHVQGGKNVVDHCVIVGHHPQISWLLQLHGNENLLDRNETKRRALSRFIGLSPTKSYGLATGELILLEPRGRPRFVFSPSDPNVGKEIREKIKSKMDAAKVLGTFFTALFTFAANGVLDRTNSSSLSTGLAVGGLGLLALATVLYFYTVIFYDHLLMPTRFWSSGLPGAYSIIDGKKYHVLRPPGSDVWILYQNMLRVWNRAFLPGTVLAAAGIALITLAFADPDGYWWLGGSAIIALVVAFSAGSYFWARPRLGVND